MTDTYTPEEFAQSLKRRGYVQYIDDGREVVKMLGKTSFTEDDFIEAYHKVYPEYVGNKIFMNYMGREWE